jgi:multicomponent Na+:H+ antiporter subunit G
MLVYLGYLLMASGLFFLFTGAVGILRLPDFYTRMHASGKCETLGLMLMVFGVAAYNGVNLVSLKILSIAVFLFLAGPAATHAVSRAFFKKGLPVWRKNHDAP